ncbi:MAG: PTS ascorbate transporter subunit IIC [Erysipelotrichaceae bacterium]|nr:PTS ascorbate transporter subunit IIC [Erysipelotrichaceae bacterium]
MQVLWYIINNVITDANILISLIVMLGLIVQKKSASQVVIGMMKAFMGLIILGTGSGLMCGPINYLSPLLMKAFNIQGIVPMTTSVVAYATQNYGSQVALIIVGSFAINLLLARITPFKYIFLSGHHYLYVASAMTVGMACAGVSGLPAIILGSIIAGCYYVLGPALDQPFMKNITGGQPLAMGHFGASGYWLAGQLGKLFSKDKDKSTEDLKFPEGLGFLKETVCAVAIVMAIIMAVAVVAAGPSFLAELGVTQSAITFVITQGMTFGAGLTILLVGIRMLIAELLTAFEGIATKVIPNALPALDCPVVFPYAPNAVMIGFISATVAGILFSIVFAAITGTFVVPPMIEFFFMGGAGAVFGNSTGGVKGAILGGAINGILFIVLPYAYFAVCNNILGPLYTSVVDPDFCWAGMLSFALANVLKTVGLR